jgi:hypothetical protein
MPMGRTEVQGVHRAKEDAGPSSTFDALANVIQLVLLVLTAQQETRRQYEKPSQWRLSACGVVPSTN